MSVLAWVTCAVIACGGKKKPIAELTKADGPVAKQEGNEQAPWTDAPTGTGFFLGDAVRTADGGAQLKLANGALITMQPHTELRFGRGKSGAARISVVVGTIDLEGAAGSYGFDVGDVSLKQQGKVTITASGTGGRSSVELKVGVAEISTEDGKVLTLEIGKAITIELGVGNIVITPATSDAGIDAAEPVDAAPVDAVPSSDVATVEITGLRAEILKPGETKWTKLPAGAGTIDPGSKLRLGNGTTAKLTANGTTLDLAGGSLAAVEDGNSFRIEAGSGRAKVEQGAEGKVLLPGGDIGLKGGANSDGEAKLDLNTRSDAKATITGGTARLTGSGGATLDLNRGESATLKKNGVINPDTVIPRYFDMRIVIGETPNFTIHDPKGATAVQFAFNGKCSGGVIEVDRDNRFRTPRVSEGRDSANMMFPLGGWAYRLRCGNGGAVASGRVVVTRDDGRRALPKKPPKNFIDADGRNYRIYYQSVIPDIDIKGSGDTLHLATGGNDETIPMKGGVASILGSKLKEATYTYWTETNGTKGKLTTLQVLFDQTAPQVYIESPANGAPFEGEIDVRGAVLPGWTAKVDIVDIPIDARTRRFAAKVPPPSAGNALAIRLSHPQRGIHFYLRRGAK